MVTNFVSQDKYDIKCPYPMNPKGICIHNTANDASAKNEVAYMNSNYSEISFHIAVDDIEAIQAVPYNRNAWAAGDGNSGDGNRNYIHLEICYSKSGGDKFVKAEKRAAYEVALICKERGWGVNNIRDHRSFSGKNCPHRTDMNNFKYMVQVELNKLNTPVQAYKARTGYLNVKPFMKTFPVFKDDKNFADWNRLVLLGCEKGLSLKILENKSYAVYKVECKYGIGYAYAEDNNNTTITDKPAFEVSEPKKKGYEDFRWRATANGTEFANGVTSDKLVESVKQQLAYGYYEVKINRTDL